MVLTKEMLKWPLGHPTDLHEPVQENRPHLGLQMRMFLHHVYIAGVGLILLQHVVPYHILTGPAGNQTQMDTMVTLDCPPLLCKAISLESMIFLGQIHKPHNEQKILSGHFQSSSYRAVFSPT